MRIVLFCHSLRSDWNHGNAHFLRGVATELMDRGHDVRVFEPANAWSSRHLVEDAGPAALDWYREAYPNLAISPYDPATLDLDRALDGADLVLMHEWNERALVREVGRRRASGGRFHLLFHDTHHRSVSEPEAIAAYGIEAYDGVLAFGEVIRERYVACGWARRAWTWHEAADVRVFAPRLGEPVGDLVWIGNWGDGERSDELRHYLVAPATALGLRSRVYGVRYEPSAQRELRQAGIEYAGWLPNFRAPEVFGRFRVTVHVPRRPYVEALPGIPTIRVFEALACGIPLVSCWWNDDERLFAAGRDFLMVRTPAEMQRALRDVLCDDELAATLAAEGQRTVLARHTCAHRVNELMAICHSLDSSSAAAAPTTSHDSERAMLETTAAEGTRG
jgi:spore maturation protein CgeB